MKDAPDDVVIVTRRKGAAVGQVNFAIALFDHQPPLH